MDTAFIKNLLQLSLGQNLSWMIKSSYKNYHVKGFNSIILFQSDNLTIRLYICKPGETQLNPYNDNILVHNHRFDFQTQVLTGYMENAVYEPSETETEEGVWYKYLYESALKNHEHKMRLELLDKTYLNLTKIERVEAGSSYFLRHDEFHRIFVPDDRLVSMLFWQHQKVENIPIIFSKVPQPENFPTEGLYNRFADEIEIRDLINLVIEHL
ncbi:MAG TPA: hypothetical protein V6D33_13310 [Cyanophyceae cyanobacterium]